MPRYFFHIQDHQMFRDEEGTLLPDLAAARTEASQVAAGYLRDHPADVWSPRMLTITVEDETGLMLFQITVSGHDSPAIGRSAFGDGRQATP
jgi:hypothetical protein